MAKKSPAREDGASWERSFHVTVQSPGGIQRQPHRRDNSTPAVGDVERGRATAAPPGWLRHSYRSNTTIPMIMAHSAAKGRLRWPVRKVLAGSRVPTVLEASSAPKPSGTT